MDIGRYLLSGTAGQPDTQNSESSTYSVSGGFWQGDNVRPDDVNADRTDTDEHQPPGTVVASFTTTDPDTGDTHTYTLVSGEGDTDNAAFFTDGATLKNTDIFSFNEQETYTVRVRATDSDGNFIEKIFVIQVSDTGEIVFDEVVNQIEPVSDNDSNEFFSPGDTLRYTAIIPNTGDRDAENAVFTVPVHPDVTFVPGSLRITVSENLYDTDISDLSTPVYNESLSRVEWSGAIPDGVEFTVTFDVTANEDLKAGDTVTAQATLVYDTDGDGTPDNSELADGDGENKPAKISVPIVPFATGTVTLAEYTAATLTGTVNPQRELLNYYFEYGETPDYGFATPETSAGDGYDNVTVSAYPECLKENTVYHYRIVTVDAYGTRHYGEDRTFATDWTLPGGDYKWMYKDDDRFTGWATGWTDRRFGTDLTDESRWLNPEYALDKADSDCDDSFLALGTGGSIVMTFDYPITDGPGDDFAIFAENTGDNWLELAFVAVSSDGKNFVQFDTRSDLKPWDTYGADDAALISGFAGRYRAGYGTPFDLAALSDKPEVKDGTVNPDRITHIRITDVRGGYDMDSDDNVIYDAHYYTATSRAGFDLDAVGVIHQVCDYGDVNGDGDVNLEDAVTALKILSGIPVGNICLSADVNEDLKIGFEELVFILRKISEK